MVQKNNKIAKKKTGNTNGRNRNPGNQFRTRLAPQAQTSVFTNTGPPRVVKTGSSMVIKHRELVQQLVGSTAMACVHLRINPGNESVFPWLSTSAYYYEMYKFRSLKFIYKPSCPTTTAGTVVITPDYDPRDLRVDTIGKALAAVDAVQTAPWAPVVCNLQAKALHADDAYKYTSARAHAIEARAYDVANVFIFTDGFAAATSSGQIFAEYEIELFLPQVHRGDTDALRTEVKSSGDEFMTTATQLDVVLGTMVRESDAFIANGASDTFTLKVGGLLQLVANLAVHSDTTQDVTTSASFNLNGVPTGTDLYARSEITAGDYRIDAIESLLDVEPGDTISLSNTPVFAGGAVKLAASITKMMMTYL